MADPDTTSKSSKPKKAAKPKAKVLAVPTVLSSVGIEDTDAGLPVLPMMALSPDRPRPAVMPSRSVASAKSPFADGYDIDAERLALADLYELENPIDDARFPRLVELEEREKQLRHMQGTAKMRQNADRMVSDAEAAKIGRIGSLVNSEQDLMIMHTRDSYRLFMGRDKDANAYGSVSGKRAAAAIRSVWLLSGNDNPYADWMLIQTETRIMELRQSLAKATSARIDELRALASRGLQFSVLASEEPAKVELGFQSPYGFMLADLIVEIDYASRVIKTLTQKNLMSKKEGEQALAKEALTPARSIFETLIPLQRMLQKEEIAPLTRADWGSKDVLAQKRVDFALKCFGECPREIFTGEKEPRHSRRNDRISKEEASYLRNVPLGAEALI
jgi:integrating conjugative element protein (TIGR03761 family)